MLQISVIHKKHIDKITDKNMVKKVVTFKAGHFVLSNEYDRQGLADKLVEARVLRETVAELPILPAISSHLEEETIIRSIFGTAALEGNPLSEKEVGQVLSQAGPEETRDRAQREVANLKRAYNLVRESRDSEGPDEIIEGFIRSLHQIITDGIEHPRNQPGRYRGHKVLVGDAGHGGVYTPPKILPDIETLMAALVEWINSPEVMADGALVRAALLHYHLGIIHPFADGNGRTARLMEAMVLANDGIRLVPAMLSNYYYQHMDEYYWAFSLCLKDKNKDVTPFVDFVLTAFIASIREMKGRMTFFIRKFALRDFIAYRRAERDITHRQHELLRLLLESHASFSLRDLFVRTPFSLLYEKVTERTARRDLERLTTMGLIWRREDGKYEINLNALDAL